jgi:hypothetical protein
MYYFRPGFVSPFGGRPMGKVGDPFLLRRKATVDCDPARSKHGSLARKQMPKGSFCDPKMAELFGSHGDGRFKAR